MSVLEVGDDGMLHVPATLLPGAGPHSQYELEHMGNMALLRPAASALASPERMTPADRVEAFERWLKSPHPPAPDLPAECLRRENLYD